jgi:hypothetical protein
MVCPVYRESELSLSTIEQLFGRSGTPQAVQSRKQNMLRNESIRFVAFPAKDSASIDEPFVVALSIALPSVKNMVVSTPPILRLSYRSLSFLQWRIGAMYLRDVQDSDETRDY